MKKQISSVISKLVLGMAFLTAVIAVQAQSPANEPGNAEKTALIKYLGIQDDMVLFNVSYQNSTGGKFSVIVRDQDGVQLFQSAYRSKSFDKQFKLPKADKNKITFIIRNYKDEDIARTFEINVNSRLVEDVAVKKLN